MTAHLHNRVIQQIGRALIRARQQDTNTSNSLDNAIASSESENNDTPYVEEEVNANMPDLNNEDLLPKVRPRHFVGTPKVEYSYNVWLVINHNLYNLML